MFERLLNKILRHILLPFAKVKIVDSKYRIPRLTYNNFYKDTYDDEKWMKNLLDNLHKNGRLNICIDVGVNIGQTLLKMKSINSKLKYYGFEPNPFCCSLTEQIITTNNLSDCHIIPCGLSDTNQLLNLSLVSKNDLLDSSASLIAGFRKQEFTKTQFVAVLKLDEILNGLNIKKIDLIKIDIEGAELEAINGMIKTLTKFKPILIIEVLPSYTSDNTFRINRQNELGEVINATGYNIYHIKNKDTNPYYDKIKTFKIHGNLLESDYLLIPDNINIDSFSSIL